MALSRKAGLDLLRGRLLSSLAPSLSHALRGLLNIVVLSGEVVRLSTTGARNEAVALAAGETLRTSTARFREVFDSFLNNLVTSDPGDAWREPSRVMHDAAALIEPLALERKIAVEISCCPPGFPRDPLPASLATVLAFAAAEVLREVADGGRVLFLASVLASGAQIVVSGGPSREAESAALSVELEDALAAFGGSRSAVHGSGFSFDIPVTPP